MLFNEEGNWYPIVVFEEFWLLREKYIPMNDTVGELPLYLRIKSSNFWWMQLQQQVGGPGGVVILYILNYPLNGRWLAGA